MAQSTSQPVIVALRFVDEIDAETKASVVSLMRLLSFVTMTVAMQLEQILAVATTLPYDMD